MGVISTCSNCKAMRLNEITKEMSIKKRFKQCTLDCSETRGQEERRDQPRLF